jgi:hypothetical protein
MNSYFSNLFRSSSILTDHNEYKSFVEKLGRIVRENEEKHRNLIHQKEG